MAADTLFGRSRVRSKWLGAGLGYGMGAGASAAGFGKFAPLAYAAGRELGDVIKTFTGFGEYNVNSNSLYEGAQAPLVRNFGSNAVVVSHREYVTDIIAPSTAGAFELRSFMINPGLSQLFEFLAQISVNYEQYVPLGVIFSYRAMSGEASNLANTALGTIIMGTNYNVYEPNFAGKAEMEATQYVMSCKPSSSMMHPIECDMSLIPQDMLYIRSGNTPSGADQRLYDLANFQIAVSGYPVASTLVNPIVLGELWVSYEFAFLKPRLYASLGRNIDEYQAFSSQSLGVGVPVTYANIFGVPLSVRGVSNISVSVTCPSNGVGMFVLPPYPMPTTYNFTIYYLSTVAVANNKWTLGNFVNCAQPDPSLYPPLTWSPDVAVGSVNTTTQQLQFWIVNQGNNKTTSFHLIVNGVAISAWTNCTMDITQCSNS